jgi:L-malate glycosyltransferase
MPSRAEQSNMTIVSKEVPGASLPEESRGANRIRILSVIDGLGFAGDESRLLSMSLNLNQQRFKHSILTLNRMGYGPANEYTDRLQQFRRAGVVVEDLDEVEPEASIGTKIVPQLIYRKTGILRRARRLARFVRRCGVNVIDARLESAGLVGALAGKLAKTPASITMYGGYSPETGLDWPWPTQIAMKLATSVITDSHIRANQMRAFLRSSTSKVAVIPNGISRPESSKSVAEIRRSLGLPIEPEVRIIGQVGRVIEYKGHEVLIRAAQRVLSSERNVAFLVVGYTRRESYKQHLRAMANDLGIADRIVITEYAGDIADVWKVIDIHAHASLFDSLPISIAEGMSLGKPAVVTDTGGIPELVLDGQTGLVVPADDAGALAKGLVILLRNSLFARRLGQNASERYEKLYRPVTMLSALEQHFTMMAGRK